MCAAPGHCECIEMIDGVPVLVKPEECYSCAVCYFLCPRDAMTMEEVTV
jgi:NAD-dependent dihydropyrimidine dehydrogenase PreA subunit